MGQETSDAPREEFFLGVRDKWSECWYASKTLPTELCVRLARRRQRRDGMEGGGTVDVVAASEIYDIAFEGVWMPEGTGDELGPAIERVREFGLALDTALRLAER